MRPEEGGGGLPAVNGPAILRQEGGNDAEQALRQKKLAERLIALAEKRDRSVVVEAILQYFGREG